MYFSNCFSCAIQDLHLFILYHECTNGTMPSTLLVLRTIPPTLRTFPPNRPKWVHFCRALPHSAKESPFPGIRKAGRGRTLSGQMTPFLHFISLKGKSLSLSPYILTSYQSKHAKRTTQASYQNLGGYMASYGYSDTRDGCTHRLSSRCNSPYYPTFLATTLHSFSQNAMPYVQISFTRYRRSTAV